MTSAEPLLTIVVPVYRVEPYLRQCLDSVLRDAGDDVEVVVVDDASPDGCPAIMDAYAREDSRVRALHLTRNVGLGEARNAGLDQASGTYVWFVDSDDWLPDGTLPAVVAALREHQPDLLLLDHVRVYDADGRRENDPSSPLLRGVRGVTRLADRPELLGFQHAAWNRVIRRDMLTTHGIRFHPGWYEDCAFSHPVLLAARRVAALDRVCYCYRQRVEGSITRTLSDRHLEVFDQYERLFDWVDRLGQDADRFRPQLFRLMVNHCLVIVGNEDRLPPGIRSTFFRRLAGHYRRYLPPGGYPAPGGVAGLKHRMVRHRAYLAYAALRTGYRGLARLSAIGRGVRAARPAPAPADLVPTAAGLSPAPAGIGATLDKRKVTTTGNRAGS